MRGRGRGAGCSGRRVLLLRPPPSAAGLSRAGAEGALPAGRRGLAFPRRGSCARARLPAAAGLPWFGQPGRGEGQGSSAAPRRGEPRSVRAAAELGSAGPGCCPRRAAPRPSAPPARRRRPRPCPAVGRCTWQAGPPSPCAATAGYAMVGLGNSEDRGCRKLFFG